MPIQKTPMRHARMRKSPQKNRRWWIIGALMLCAAALIVGYFWHMKRKTDNYIAQDIARLEEIFKSIDSQCGIIGFDHDVNYVDFLTVGSFAGSHVGALNLKNPEQWHGPYVEDNPKIQEKPYEVVRTCKGCFLIPGHGATLADGRVIGRDIVISYDSDIEDLIKNGSLCTQDGKPLACAVAPKP